MTDKYWKAVPSFTSGLLQFTGCTFSRAITIHLSMENYSINDRISMHHVIVVGGEVEGGIDD